MYQSTISDRVSYYLAVLRTMVTTCGVTAVVLACGPAISRGNDGVPSGLQSLEKSHKQLKSIPLQVAETGAKLQDFCVNREGQVVALLANKAQIGSMGALLSKIKAGGKESQTAQVRILDHEGTLVRQWDVDFVGEAIGVGPDGIVYVGGNGVLASYDAEGKLLQRHDAPQTTLLANKEELQEHAKEQLEAEKQSITEQLKQFEAILDDPKQLEEIEKQYQAQLDEQLKSQAKAASDDSKKEAPVRPKIQFNVKQMYEQQVKALKSRKESTVEQMVASITTRLKQVNAIAVSDQDVFIACPMSKGYGYAVWRTDRDLQNPKQVISGLSGCCGQMDIQASGDQVFVAENSRHRVVRYNRDGKKQGTFGKTDREGVGEGFGGCCNPMNLCFAADGGLLAAESNGVVKRFTSDGKYEGLVGIAKVPEGCKNSAIGISTDGQQVYYIDIQNSNIIILARDERAAAKSE